MKESVTKFDLEAAFKALDEIETPIAANGIIANRAALTEIFSRKSKFDALFEEYYNIDDTGLTDAKEDREAEIAQAKLARIEKIVDLDADSADDLLTSYVGKYIIQCPQCMTLFYKNQEDVEASEEDSNTVNVNEVCQHCGNDSGYTLVGKVGEVTQEDNNEVNETEDTVDTTDENSVEANDEVSEESTSVTDELNLDDEELDIEIEEDDEETQEAFSNRPNGIYLNEQLIEGADLEVSADEFEQLIKSPEFKKPISDMAVRAMLNTEESVNSQPANSMNEGIFDKLKDTVDKLTSKLKSRAAKADFILQNAREDYTNISVDHKGELVPDEKNQRFRAFIVVGFSNKYSNGKEITIAPSYNNKDLVISDKMKRPEARTKFLDADNIAKGWSQALGNGPAFIYLAKDPEDSNAVFLCQYFKGELVNDQVEKYFNVVKKDLAGAKLIAKGGGIHQEADSEVEISSTSAEQTESLNNVFAELEELKESVLESVISDSLVNTYSNVAGFKVKNCTYLNEKFNIDGTIYFTSGNTRNTTYTFTEAYSTINKENTRIKLHGLNEKLGIDTQFILIGHIDKSTKTFITEDFKRIQ